MKKHVAAVRLVDRDEATEAVELPGGAAPVAAAGKLAWERARVGRVGGRRVPVERPRGRTVAGDEIELATYAAFSNDDLLSQVVRERLLAGVATRRHARVNEPVGDDLDAQARSTSRSSVSRRRKGYRQMPTFVAALARHLEAVTPVCDAARVA